MKRFNSKPKPNPSLIIKNKEQMGIIKKKQQEALELRNTETTVQNELVKNRILQRTGLSNEEFLKIKLRGKILNNDPVNPKKPKKDTESK